MLSKLDHKRGLLMAALTSSLFFVIVGLSSRSRRAKLLHSNRDSAKR